MRLAVGFAVVAVTQGALAQEAATEPAEEKVVLEEAAEEPIVPAEAEAAPKPETARSLAVSLAADRKAAMLEFDTGQREPALVRLRGAIQRCLRAKDICSDGTLAVLWRDLGIVLAQGYGDSAGATDAFERALLLSPQTAIPAPYESPAVRSAYEAAGGTWTAKAESPPVAPEPAKPPPPPAEPWWDGEPPEEPTKPRGLVMLSYSFGVGVTAAFAGGQSLSAATIKQGASGDLLFSVPTQKAEMLLGFQLRGGAYHGSSPYGLITSGYFGGLAEAGGWLDAKRQGLVTVGFGAEANDGLALFVTNLRVAGRFGPMLLGVGSDFEVTSYSGVLLVGVQPQLHIGLQGDL
jgi:hypothetical protein